MSFSDFERARLTKILEKWVDEVPSHVRTQFRHGFRIGASEVVIFESRPAFEDRGNWRDMDIAKFRYVKAAEEWRLYCQFRDLRWRAYQPMPSAHSFDELFAEVKRDPTGIFWG